MKDDTLVMRGAPVRALHRPNRVWRAGRVCAEALSASARLRTDVGRAASM